MNIFDNAIMHFLLYAVPWQVYALVVALLLLACFKVFGIKRTIEAGVGLLGILAIVKTKQDSFSEGQQNQVNINKADTEKEVKDEQQIQAQADRQSDDELRRTAQQWVRPEDKPGSK